MNDDLRLDPRADEAPDALEEGRLSRAFVSDVAAALDSGDDDGVRALVSPLHPADVADLFAAIPADARVPLADALGDQLRMLEYPLRSRDHLGCFASGTLR